MRVNWVVPESWVTKLSRNVSNYVPIDTASYPRKLEFLPIQFDYSRAWQYKRSQLKVNDAYNWYYLPVTGSNFAHSSLCPSFSLSWYCSFSLIFSFIYCNPPFLLSFSIILPIPIYFIVFPLSSTFLLLVEIGYGDWGNVLSFNVTIFKNNSLP